MANKFLSWLFDKHPNLEPSKHYIEQQFIKRLGYPLNLVSPKTFNEKLNWLKLHDRKPFYTKMVDKIEVKNYVASKFGSRGRINLITTLGVWKNADSNRF